MKRIILAGTCSGLLVVLILLGLTAISKSTTYLVYYYFSLGALAPAIIFDPASRIFRMQANWAGTLALCGFFWFLIGVALGAFSRKTISMVVVWWVIYVLAALIAYVCLFFFAT